mgnify:CR=1 FL=1
MEQWLYSSKLVLMKDIKDPREGDYYIDDVKERAYYFTGNRWIDITSDGKIHVTREDPRYLEEEQT